ncbi:MAG: alpha/beta fold hydrolase [Gemmatimonadota bacterium]|jgi:hypothetical protein
MRLKMATTALALLASLGIGTGQASAQATNPLVGTWLGRLSAGGATLRIVFNVTADSAGALKATMDSPDQGANGLPVAGVSLTGDTVRFDVQVAAGGYTGTIADDGRTITGTWSQSGMDFPLTLEKQAGPVKAPERPQEPKPPFPYDVEDVAFANPQAPGVTLAGSLTIPRGDGPFPAVVLVSGSGAQNRDEELLTHKPFLVLSDYLTRHGIAVLRYDDRGVAKSTGNFATATSADLATDAFAAVEFLKTRARIDPAMIGIAGHSEGGIIAPMVAAESDDVAFIVLLAGTGVNGEQILLLQTTLIAEAAGVDPADIESNRGLQERIFAVLKSDVDSATASARIADLVREQIAGMTPERRAEAGVATDADIERAVRTQTAQATSPWMRFFLTYEPSTALQKVHVPVLALNGSKDLQVPPKQNLAAIRQALQDAGNKDVTIRELPGLNHLFQTAGTGSPSEYATIEETMSPVALQTIADWINERFGSGR